MLAYPTMLIGNVTQVILVKLTCVTVHNRKQNLRQATLELKNGTVKIHYI